VPVERGISFEALLSYDEEETERWRQWFSKRPHLLKVEASPTQLISDLIFHLFAAELRVAQRLLGEAMTPDRELNRARVDDLFDIGRSAREKLRNVLSSISEEDFNTPKKYPSPTLGEFEASPAKLLTHALVHSIRHWGQVATILRSHGHRADWSHDVLFSKAIR
jgi:uncharacterized damage-inducible protein DinB